MSLLDDASSLVNRGIASAGRGTKSLTLKAQIGDLNRKREGLASQLGASLYEETRTDPRFRASREALYASIEALDAERLALQEELVAIERQAQISAMPVAAAICPSCGGAVGADDVFCSTCGTNVIEARKDVRLCSKCSSPLSPDDLFCMACGTPVAAVPDPAPAYEPVFAEEPDPAPLDGPSSMPESVHAADPALVPEPPAPATELDSSSAAEPEPEFAPPSPGSVPVPIPAPVSMREPAFASASASDRAFDAGRACEVASTPDPTPEPAIAPAVDPGKTMPIEDFLKNPVGMQAGMCPQCGYVNVSEARFCRNCGQSL